MTVLGHVSANAPMEPSVERETEEFDEEAVEKYLAEKKAAKQKQQPVLACGCPSTNIQTFAPVSSCREANIPAGFEDSESALSHWPIQIRLVPATAPFLKGADLLAAQLTRSKQRLIPRTLVPLWVAKQDDLKKRQWPGVELFQYFMAFFSNW